MKNYEKEIIQDKINAIKGYREDCDYELYVGGVPCSQYLCETLGEFVKYTVVDRFTEDISSMSENMLEVYDLVDDFNTMILPHGQDFIEGKINSNNDIDLIRFLCKCEEYLLFDIVRGRNNMFYIENVHYSIIDYLEEKGFKDETDFIHRRIRDYVVKSVGNSFDNKDIIKVLDELKVELSEEKN